MKKLMMIAAMMIAALSANAQNEVGQITLQPKVGINISTVTNSDSKAKVGLAAGVEAEYGVAENFGVTLGLLYSMQGDKPKVGSGSEKLDYINIPIMAQYYVIPGLAIKAGIQPGFLVRAKQKYDYENGGIAIHTDGDIKDGCKKFDFSIPVGISYEYKSFVLDARYNIGLTKVYKDIDADAAELLGISNKTCRNSVFQITLGYKFAL